MAAFLNDTWGKLKGGASSLKNNLLGPEYSYADKIPTAESKGIGARGDFGQITTNIRGALDYVEFLRPLGVGQTPPTLGNSYFVNTGGTCIAPNGTLQSRYNYIDNRPDPNVAYGLFGNGLLGGVVTDVVSLNPTGMLRAVAADATPACQKYKCDVTDQLNGDTQYLTPKLTQNFDPNKCKLVPETQDPIGEKRAEVNRLNEEIKNIQQLLAKEPKNKALRDKLEGSGGLKEQVATLEEELKDLPERQKKYESIKESFETPHGAALGVAAIALAMLIFSRRA